MLHCITLCKPSKWSLTSYVMHVQFGIQLVKHSLMFSLPGIISDSVIRVDFILPKCHSLPILKSQLDATKANSFSFKKNNKYFLSAVQILSCLKRSSMPFYNSLLHIFYKLHVTTLKKSFCHLNNFFSLKKKKEKRSEIIHAMKSTKDSGVKWWSKAILLLFFQKCAHLLLSFKSDRKI